MLGVSATNMDLGLSGQTALISGASKGIGFATAETFAAEGCSVVLAARSAADLEVAATSLERRFKQRPKTFQFDVSSSKQRNELVIAHPGIDVLVNCAGAIPPGTVESIDDSRWREAWETKVFGYINLTRAYFAKMKERGCGVIVNIIGIAAERPDADYIAGCTGNAALVTFTKSLGGSSLYNGVRVVGINPGPVGTERLIRLQKATAKTKLGDEARWPELLQSLPMQRAAKPEEIADMVAFLASKRSSYVSGTVVTIDGGLSSRNPLL
jgi:NAD(P)-dependent dehydrogenase (short-subunit alcohol dehydrogenase family)